MPSGGAGPATEEEANEGLKVRQGQWVEDAMSLTARGPNSFPSWSLRLRALDPSGAQKKAKTGPLGVPSTACTHILGLPM